MERDPLQYHKWARRLAFRFFLPNETYQRDDIYQIAMVGLLELWRRDPDASDAQCMVAMHRQVIDELRKATRAKRSAILVPLDELRNASGGEDPADGAIRRAALEELRAMVKRLNRFERKIVGFYVAGANMRKVVRDLKLSRFKAQEALRTARKKLRKWMEKSA